ncbi:hypothetical protein [Cellulomonas sp.]|uniref:thioesterase domain-containing protein n=1 Tax=Cellulomonas sp. TaxID=40001 RepID=UPI001B0290E3|nr:hypothetical protein [Cellulomonas sp.]MBO9554548.1 hypothetical protein [Cellulomonas sp.]
MTLAPGWGSGYEVLGGRGATRTDLDDLAHAVDVLESAARRLDDASAAVDAARRAAVGQLIAHHAEAVLAVDALAAARTGPVAPERVADELRDLAGRLRRVVGVYDHAESWVHRLARSAAEAGAASTARSGFMTSAALVTAGVAALRDGAVLHGVLTALRERDPGALVVALERDLADAPGRLLADGRTEVAVDALAAYLIALAGHLGLPLRDGVPVVARAVAGALPPAGPTVVLARGRPPRLATPRDAADLLRNVRSTYSPPHGGAAGTPDGAITIQRLDHPDGTRSWAVEIPGTETWSVNAAAPTDLTTNLRLMAGLPDDMSTAVVEAMRQAGIPPDEPVALAGHSQGGMVAMKVAAMSVGLFDVRAVVTAGSPDIPVRVPAGVATLHVRHGEDVVPQTDGEPDRPTRDTVILRRDLAPTADGGVPRPDESHAISAYVETVDGAHQAMDGNPALRGFDDALGEVLGPPGTTSATFQYQATRAPDLVSTDPATGLPRPPMLRPAPVPDAP